MPPTLVLIPNWLGDAVMSLPALHELRRRGPLLAVGAPALLELLADLGAIDQAWPFERHGRDAGLAGMWRVAAKLRGQHPALAVVFPPSLRAAALARMAGVPRRRGFVGEGRAMLLNELRRAAVPRGARHLADDWLALVRDDGHVTPGEAVPVARSGPAGGLEWGRARAQTPSLPAPGSFVVVAPGATYGPTKRWRAQSYCELARLLARRYGLRCVVVGGADPAERALCDGVAQACEGISVAGRTSLPGLAAVLQEAAAFAGNDSGPMHLAAALGVPTVGIFGSTSPGWTAPRGRAAVSCGPHPVPCTPCFQSTCPIGLPCLENIAPEMVADALAPLLEDRAHTLRGASP